MEYEDCTDNPEMPGDEELEFYHLFNWPHEQRIPPKLVFPMKMSCP